MMSGEKNKPYVSLKLPHGLMDCRIKSGNDNREYVKRRTTLGVMPGLVPGSTSSRALDKQDVDGRDKPGHDGRYIFRVWGLRHGTRRVRRKLIMRVDDAMVGYVFSLIIISDCLYPKKFHIPFYSWRSAQECVH
jgi:hypothetical protein